MKVSCVRINTDIIVGKKQDEIISYLSKMFLGIGVVMQNIVTTQNNPENFFHAVNFLQTNTVLILGEASSSKNYVIKKYLSDLTKIELEKNEISFNNVTNYYKQENSPVLVESENEYYMPKGAFVMSSTTSPMQGFILQAGGKTYIFLPEHFLSIQEMYEKEIKPFFTANSSIKYKTHIIKTFGIFEKDIYSILGDLTKNIYKILFITYPSELEVSLHIRYNETIDPEIIRGILAKVYEKLSKYIYADEDVSLAKRVFDLMKLSNKTISIAESVTGGNITSSLIKANPDFALSLKESIVCPSVESKIKSLGVTPAIIEKYGEVSIETAYEMAAALLDKTNSDIVLCTTGSLDTGNNNEKKVAFISVGNVDGIHVYKNTFIGNREQVIGNITQTSLFYLIKNIKQNDWFFGQTTV